jgi:hypothetical protein
VLLRELEPGPVQLPKPVGDVHRQPDGTRTVGNGSIRGRAGLDSRDREGGLGGLFQEGEHLKADQLVGFEVDQDFRESPRVGAFVHLADEIRTDPRRRGQDAEEVAPCTDREPSEASPWGVQGTGTGAGAGVVGTGGPTDGNGVVGSGAGAGAGVVGMGATGVRGTGQVGGAGILAENPGGGTALQVSGPSVFSRSGTVSIAAGQSKATVTPPGGLTASSVVLALLQNVPGNILVKAAIPNVGAGTFDVQLSAAVPIGKTAVVAWVVVN